MEVLLMLSCISIAARVLERRCPPRGAFCCIVLKGVFFFLAVCSVEGRSFQSGVPSYEFFESKQIGANHPITGLSTDPLGRLVAVSGSDLLVYDGTAWQRMRQSVPEGETVVSLFRVLAGPDGVLYASSPDGLHQVKIVGNQRYALLPVSTAGGDSFRFPSDLRGGFVANESLFLYGVEDTVFYNTTDKTVSMNTFPRRINSRFEPIDDGVVEYLSDNYISIHAGEDEPIRVSNNRELLALSETRSLAVWDDEIITGHDNGLSIMLEDEFVVLNTEIDELLSRNVRDVVPLADGSLAVFVEAQGIFVLDREGTILQAIDRRVDHRFGELRNFMASGDQGWASVGKSIVRIDFLRALTAISPIAQYSMSYPNVFYHEDSLHMVTDGKLLRIDCYEGGGLKGFVDLLPDYPRSAQTATSYGDAILFSDFESVLRLGSEGGASKVLEHERVDLLARPDLEDDYLISIGRDSFRLAKRIGSDWKWMGDPVVAEGRSYFVENSTDGSVWLEKGTATVTQLSVVEDRLRKTVYGPAAGFNNAWVNVWKYKGDIMFSSGAGTRVHRWDSERKLSGDDQPRDENSLERYHWTCSATDAIA